MYTSLKHDLLAYCCIQELGNMLLFRPHTNPSKDAISQHTSRHHPAMKNDYRDIHYEAAKMYIISMSSITELQVFKLSFSFIGRHKSCQYKAILKTDLKIWCDNLKYSYVHLANNLP